MSGNVTLTKRVKMIANIALFRHPQNSKTVLSLYTGSNPVGAANFFTDKPESFGGQA
jgi:hypothetical protein